MSTRKERGACRYYFRYKEQDQKKELRQQPELWDEEKL